MHEPELCCGSSRDQSFNQRFEGLPDNLHSSFSGPSNPTSFQWIPDQSKTINILHWEENMIGLSRTTVFLIPQLYLRRKHIYEVTITNTIIEFNKETIFRTTICSSYFSTWLYLRISNTFFSQSFSKQSGLDIFCLSRTPKLVKRSQLSISKLFCGSADSRYCTEAADIFFDSGRCKISNKLLQIARLIRPTFTNIDDTEEGQTLLSIRQAGYLPGKRDDGKRAANIPYYARVFAWKRVDEGSLCRCVLPWSWKTHWRKSTS